jgi:hypothetical protein
MHTYAYTQKNAAKQDFLHFTDWMPGFMQILNLRHLEKVQIELLDDESDWKIMRCPARDCFGVISKGEAEEIKEARQMMQLLENMINEYCALAEAPVDWVPYATEEEWNNYVAASIDVQPRSKVRTDKMKKSPAKWWGYRITV